MFVFATLVIFAAGAAAQTPHPPTPAMMKCAAAIRAANCTESMGTKDCWACGDKAEAALEKTEDVNCTHTGAIGSVCAASTLRCEEFLESRCNATEGDKKKCKDCVNGVLDMVKKEHPQYLKSCEKAAQVWSDADCTKNKPTQPVCTNDQYCCPDAKHCVTPVKNSTCEGDKKCPSADDVCCPLTKLCVKVGAACVSPCMDKGSYCCPDAKHCLTPTNPGVLCEPDSVSPINPCKKDEICCPLTKECVTVGAACVPGATNKPAWV